MMRPVTVNVNWAAPPAPTNLAFTRGSVILTWDDLTPVDYLDPFTWGSLTPGVGGTNPSYEVGFRIEQAAVSGPDAGVFVEVANAPANATTYTYTPADQTITYDYRVTAWNEAGASSSNVIRVEGLPAAPTSLSAVVEPKSTLPAGYQVALGWINDALNSTNVIVERAVGTGAFSVLATLAATDTSYVDTDVVPGTYSYQVKAENTFGQSAPVGPATVTVPQSGSTTVLSSDGTPSTVGQDVVFTAIVSSVLAAGTPSGTVEFFDGATSLGSSTLAGPGPTAGFSIATLAVGTHTITAVYSGDTVFAASASADLIQVVNPGTSATAVTSDANPSVYGTPVTFTATVSVAGAVGPTGTVEFFDGATSLGAPALAGGTASVTSDTLGVGSHTITAVYSGDANLTTSTSGDLIQVVGRAASSTSVTSDVNPSVYGTPVTFTATVSVPSGTPTGAVEFFDGSTSLGTTTLVGGTATLTIDTLGGGSHTITAVYSGDADFDTSTSGFLIQVVGRAASSTSVTSDVNPSVYGTPVTFTAIVSVSFGSPTGSVEFFDGTTTLGTIPLIGATATLTTDTLAGGSHAITAVYSGDPNFATSSTSGDLFQVVNQGTTSASLASSLNPSVTGDSVTFTATVSVLTGIGNPTGTVQFFDGTTSLGAPTLSVAPPASRSPVLAPVATHDCPRSTTATPTSPPARAPP